MCLKKKDRQFPKIDNDIDISGPTLPIHFRGCRLVCVSN